MDSGKIKVHGARLNETLHWRSYEFTRRKLAQPSSELVSGRCVRLKRIEERENGKRKGNVRGTNSIGEKTDDDVLSAHLWTSHLAKQCVIVS